MRTISMKILALTMVMGLIVAAAPALAGVAIPQHLQTKVNKTLCEAGQQPLATMDSADLLAMLESFDPRVRYVAVYTLGDIREPKAVEPLLAMLTNPDPNLRRMSAHALGKIGDKRALLPLAYVLNTIDEQSLVRYEASMAMHRMPGGEATQLLMASHCTDCPLVHRSVILALQSRAYRDTVIK